jgi:hypothetical protein
MHELNILTKRRFTELPFSGRAISLVSQSLRCIELLQPHFPQVAQLGEGIKDLFKPWKPSEGRDPFDLKNTVERLKGERLERSSMVGLDASLDVFLQALSDLIGLRLGCQALSDELLESIRANLLGTMSLLGGEPLYQLNLGHLYIDADRAKPIFGRKASNDRFVGWHFTRRDLGDLWIGDSYSRAREHVRKEWGTSRPKQVSFSGSQGGF